MLISKRYFIGSVQESTLNNNITFTLTLNNNNTCAQQQLHWSSSTITRTLSNKLQKTLNKIYTDAQQQLQWRLSTFTMTLNNNYTELKNISSSIITSEYTESTLTPGNNHIDDFNICWNNNYLKENKFLSQSLFRTKFCCTWLAQDDSSFALQKSRQNSNNLFKCLKVNAHIETMLCRFPFVPCTPRWAWLHFNCTCSMWLNIIWIYETITVISS